MQKLLLQIPNKLKVFDNYRSEILILRYLPEIGIKIKYQKVLIPEFGIEKY